MKSRSARLALLVLFVLALGVTAYLFRKGEIARRAETAAADVFNAKARSTSRSILELRAAQQAYVATGQGEDFWAARVTSTLANVKEGLTALRAAAISTDGQAALEAASGSIQDFAQMDGRARTYVRGKQSILASDLIFSNGNELTDAAVGALEKAASAEQVARAGANETLASRQSFALVAAAAAAVLIVLLLLPAGEPELSAPAFLEPTRPGATSAAPLARRESWSTARKANQPAPPIDAPPMESPAAPAVAEVPAVPPMVAPPAPPVPAFNFTAMAALCTDLSRVDDTMALPPLLERAATLLDAAGIILWIADPDGRELNPVLAQGYPQHLINRLGAIPRGAENATAAAFRTATLQTVYGDASTNGAIAAPLVTCGGCVGVMAAEVRGDTEKLDANLAAATILAAQLAALVGPPAARPADTSIEAANA
ncbi:MAG: GAF domain-containing protein [Vicinamibacterales bacterium]